MDRTEVSIENSSESKRTNNEHFFKILDNTRHYTLASRVTQILVFHAIFPGSPSTAE